ncbi:nucleotidyltransferase family protein [Rufibacter psychrotolerans]|uniref:nucleotidyltransferase family protein n=1 Tax=Rufibacter psychrotolerans TaxID=2812556 RepID=UPI0019677808|nr:nucleotidyltransferase family protein [Rufibacter sp. SYSU D00308]
MAKTGIIILAAGASSRLGQAKQQLTFQGQTLLQRTIEAAVDAEQCLVVVVLGANAEQIQPTLEPSEVPFIHNPGWAEGMASSIRVGLTEALRKEPELEAVIFLLSDQPFVEASLLNKMIQTQAETGKSMVACSYQDTLGAPVLFTKELFPELQQLKGQEGAKKLLARYSEKVAEIPFPKGAIDIDTPSDYAALQQIEENE